MGHKKVFTLMQEFDESTLTAKYVDNAMRLLKRFVDESQETTVALKHFVEWGNETISQFNRNHPEKSPISPFISATSDKEDDPFDGFEVRRSMPVT
jgi:hypothetical protein